MYDIWEGFSKSTEKVTNFVLLKKHLDLAISMCLQVYNVCTYMYMYACLRDLTSIQHHV